MHQENTLSLSPPLAPDPPLPKSRKKVFFQPVRLLLNLSELVNIFPRMMRFSREPQKPYWCLAAEGSTALSSVPIIIRSGVLTFFALLCQEREIWYNSLNWALFRQFLRSHQSGER